MTIDHATLATAPRLLLEAELRPLQGHRFQPTGFADLGPARYTLPDGTEMLLVESAQSVANRMELACWDSGRNDVIEDLAGIPYVVVEKDGRGLTNSILEAHRINSEYIMNTAFKETITREIGYAADSPVDWTRLHGALLKYDIGSLLHGAFLEEIGGRLRVTRALSGFIEARGVIVAESGGVKNNIVEPTLKSGEGNVPYHRTEFTAAELSAYFNLDLALLRGYGLPGAATTLLTSLALFKVRRFLSTGLRLRTACDLEVEGDLLVKRPAGFAVPSEPDLLAECKRALAACAAEGLFADPPATRVKYVAAEKKARKKGAQGGEEAE